MNEGYNYFNGSAEEYHKYQQNRLKAIVKANFQCSNCGMHQITQMAKQGTDFHAHHKDHDVMNNRIDNLEILCTDCHYQDRHSRPRQGTSVYHERYCFGLYNPLQYDCNICSSVQRCIIKAEEQGVKTPEADPTEPVKKECFGKYDKDSMNCYFCSIRRNCHEKVIINHVGQH